jgi:arabinan endo-1,5-alpha-L-arabinosidase
MKLSGKNLKKMVVSVMGLTLLFTLSALAESDPNNQLTGSLGIHDPMTIVKSNGVYYNWGTGGRGIKSTDRKNWTGITSGSPAKSQPWWAAHGGQQWAPAVIFMGGMWYYYYSVSAWNNFNSAIGVTRSPTLDPGTWTDVGMVIDSTEAQDGGKNRVNVIDPNTITDSDGKHYLIFGSFNGGVRMAELNPATGLLMNKPSHPTVITDHAGEGSAAIQWKNYYYYAISQGKCCDGMTSTYYMSYGRATKITGPYTTKNGSSFTKSVTEVLLKGSNNSSATSGAVAVGVGGFFWDGANGLDTLFMDYMAYTAPGGSATLNIHPLYADATDWLTFDASKGTLITRPTPASTPINAKAVIHPEANHGSRFVTRITGFEPRGGSGALYGITGKKVAGEMKAMPVGIYIEKHGR